MQEKIDVLVPTIFMGYVEEINTRCPDMVFPLSIAAKMYRDSHSLDEFQALLLQLTGWMLTEAELCVSLHPSVVSLMEQARTLLNAGSDPDPWNQLGKVALMGQAQDQSTGSIALAMVLAMSMTFVIDINTANQIAQGSVGAQDNANLTDTVDAIIKNASDSARYWGRLIASKDGRITPRAVGFAYERLAIEMFQRMGGIIAVQSSGGRLN